MIQRIAPQFFTSDMDATLAYYAEKLGFACDGGWGDPVFYAIVHRDGHTIHFRLTDCVVANPDKYDDELLDAYISVDDADALYAEYRGRGVAFSRELGDVPWGAREFVVKDCDGRLLCFGGAAKGAL
jgi:catechol 2,3-dioxygenase-like lactoylglutathione lyase family enzyme